MKTALGTASILLGLIAACAGRAESPKAAHSPKERFLETEFRELDRFDQLPPVITRDLLRRFSMRSSNTARLIADPGEPYNPSDTVGDDLPSRRLVFAGASDGFWFVLYDSGGITTERHLVMYDDTSDGPVFKGRLIGILSGPTCPYCPGTIGELKVLMRQGDIRNEGASSRFW